MTVQNVLLRGEMSNLNYDTLVGNEKINISVYVRKVNIIMYIVKLCYTIFVPLTFR